MYKGALCHIQIHEYTRNIRHHIFVGHNTCHLIYDLHVFFQESEKLICLYLFLFQVN